MCSVCERKCTQAGWGWPKPALEYHHGNRSPVVRWDRKRHPKLVFGQHRTCFLGQHQSVASTVDRRSMSATIRIHKPCGTPRAARAEDLDRPVRRASFQRSPYNRTHDDGRCGEENGMAWDTETGTSSMTNLFRSIDSTPTSGQPSLIDFSSIPLGFVSSCEESRSPFGWPWIPGTLGFTVKTAPICSPKSDGSERVPIQRIGPILRT
jgi:hypothetical protein